jgi:formylglycine-generating enzyme required for sulfatase activity
MKRRKSLNVECCVLNVECLLKSRLTSMLAACFAVLLTVASAFADDFSTARFKGSGKVDLARISNVAVKPSGEAGVGTITFDLAWDWSWRAAWEVEAAQTGGKEKLKLENWDAAWVFVKYRLPGGPWRHAMLAAEAAKHTVPSGAALEVGKSNDGKKGVGVFIHRAAAGQGPNDWKGVTLRWLLPVGADAEEGGTSEFEMHATTDKPAEAAAFDPAKAEVKVLALEMVYVPPCAFWLGDGTTNTVAGQFTAGPGHAPFRVEGEHAIKLGGDTAEYLNNHDAVGMDPNNKDDFNRDQPATLPAAFPKGYAAFYCMKVEVTMAMYVEYLNMQPYAHQAVSVPAKLSLPAGTVAMEDPNRAHLSPRTGVLIQAPGTPDSMVPLQFSRETFVVSGTVTKPGTAAVFKTTMPFVPCHYIPYQGARGFAAWSGLRPMTELEFEKACRGPVKPVADEFPWGTTGIAGIAGKNPAGGKYALTNFNEETESVSWVGEKGPDATRGNAFLADNNGAPGWPTRVGIFATPQSERVTAGATYWGILDMAGSVPEKAVPVGEAACRGFSGNHGEGGPAPWGGIGLGERGGGSPVGRHNISWGRLDLLRISSRANARSYLNSFGDIHDGTRCVRTAPVEK